MNAGEDGEDEGEVVEKEDGGEVVGKEDGGEVGREDGAEVGEGGEMSQDSLHLNLYNKHLRPPHKGGPILLELELFFSENLLAYSGSSHYMQN